MRFFHFVTRRPSWLLRRQVFQPGHGLTDLRFYRNFAQNSFRGLAPGFLLSFGFLLFLWVSGVISGIPVAGASEMRTSEMLAPEQVRTYAGILPSEEGSSRLPAVGIWKPGRWVPFRVELLPKTNGQAERFCGKIVLEMPDPDGTPVLTEKKVCCDLPATVELKARFGHSKGAYRLRIYQTEPKTETAEPNLTGAAESLQKTTEPQTISGNAGVNSSAEANSHAEVNSNAETNSSAETNSGAKANSHAEAIVFETSGTLDGALRETQGLILVVGSTAAGVDSGAAQMACPGAFKPRVARLASASQLPQSLDAWELIDVLVVTTQEVSVLESWDAASLKRLALWVRHGGTLVLSVGKNADAWSRNPLWASFLPGTLEKVLPVRETAAMEVFAQSPIPVTLLGVSEKYRIPVAKFSGLPPAAEVRAQQFDLPLILRRGWGLGQIHWVTFDLEHPAITNWEGRGSLIAALLDFPEKSRWIEKQLRGLESGYDDLAGQLRSALDAFDGLRPVSFGLLCGLFLLYLGVIGPGCWFLCKKLPRGGELASWSLFLASVAGASGLLLAITSPQTAPRLNQIQVVDFVPECGEVRQALWGNLWVPNACTLDVSFTDSGPNGTVRESSGKVRNSSDSADEPSENQSWLAWFGLPGDWLGGMDSRVAVSSGFNSPEKESRLKSCRFSDDQMNGVPFRARSTQSFCASRWLRPARLPDFGKLHDFNQSRVLGEIRNPLPLPLRHCLLFYGNWAYEIGTLAPGQSVTLDETSVYFGAAALLVDADFIEDHSIKSSVGLRRVNRPYQRSSHDLEYVMRTMLFHAKAGGRSYSGLNHQYQHFLDASSLLSCRTAILYGVAENEPSASPTESFFTHFALRNSTSGTAIPLTNSQDRNVQIIRAFLPVEMPAQKPQE